MALACVCPSHLCSFFKACSFSFLCLSVCLLWQLLTKDDTVPWMYFFLRQVDTPLVLHNLITNHSFLYIFSDLWPWPVPGGWAVVSWSFATGGGGETSGGRGAIPCKGDNTQWWTAGGSLCLLGHSQALHCSDHSWGKYSTYWICSAESTVMLLSTVYCENGYKLFSFVYKQLSVSIIHLKWTMYRKMVQN